MYSIDKNVLNDLEKTIVKLNNCWLRREKQSNQEWTGMNLP